MKLVDEMRKDVITPEEAVKEANEMTKDEQRAGRRYRFRSPEARAKEYEESRRLREEVLRNKIPFITPNFYPQFYLPQGVTLVGSQSGRGKSTVAGNFAAGVLEHCKDSRVLVISNEENTDAIFERIAAVLLKVSFLKIHKKTLDNAQQKMIQQYISEKLTPRVEVVTEGDFDPAVEEDVVAVMEAAAREKFNAVVLDYHQNVTTSRNDPQKESYRVSKDLGLYYKQYGQKHGVPVVVFAQLSARNDAPNFKDRVENDKSLFNHALMAIEVIPDFETRTTTFKIHKDRFSDTTGKEIVMEFDGGRFVMANGEGL